MHSVVLTINETDKPDTGVINIANFHQVFEDPHVKATGTVQEVVHPVAGTLKVLRPTVRCNDFEVPLEPPPSLGQHTDEILKNILDYSDEKIAELRLQRVIT